MDYITQITKENQKRQAVTEWADKRRELVHQVTDFYNTRGQRFVRDLEKLLAKYESAPRFTGTEIINELTKKI
jgi:hypothetical protein